jgi:hypoxanthine phosphoribosyltransferase
MADLIRAMPVDLTVDVVRLASYGQGTRPGAVRRLVGLSVPIAGRDVVVVEDIVDTGHTLRVLLHDLEAQGPRSVRLCVLLDKIACREVDVPVDYRGFVVPDVFVVGYGLDHAGGHRNLPYVGVLEGV